MRNSALAYLTSSRAAAFAQYLRCLARDRIGSFKAREDMERWLQKWVDNYIDPEPASSSEATRAQRPLAAAEVHIEDVEGNPGHYTARFFLRPHYQLEGLTTPMRIVSRLPSPRRRHRAAMTKSGAFISTRALTASSSRLRCASAWRGRAPDIRVWQDRSEIEGGIGWWRQIEDALERVEFLVIVMTPGVLASEITRKEWRAARQSGDMRISGERSGFRLRRSPAAQVDEPCTNLRSRLSSGKRSSRTCAAGARRREYRSWRRRYRPVSWVARVSLKHCARWSWIRAQATRSRSRRRSLARADSGRQRWPPHCATDDDVVAAFDDGVLWATLGQSPNVQGELTRLYAALTGERPGFVSIEDAAQALAEKLEHKRCLIVIDDAWDVAHLRPFLRGGAGCARLVTTRQAPGGRRGRAHYGRRDDQ
jgi:hypothetical protein